MTNCLHWRRKEAEAAMSDVFSLGKYNCLETFRSTVTWNWPSPFSAEGIQI